MARIRYSIEAFTFYGTLRRMHAQLLFESLELIFQRSSLRQIRHSADGHIHHFPVITMENLFGDADPRMINLP